MSYLDDLFSGSATTKIQQNGTEVTPNLAKLNIVNGTVTYDSLNQRHNVTIAAATPVLTLAQVLANGISTNGYNINLTSGSSIYSADGYVSLNSITNLNSNRIINVPSPILPGDAVNKSYVDTHYGNVLTLAQVTANGATSSTAISMDGYEITNIKDLTFKGTETTPTITQTATVVSGYANQLTVKGQNNGVSVGNVGGPISIEGGSGWVDGYVDLKGSKVNVKSQYLVMDFQGGSQIVNGSTSTLLSAPSLIIQASQTSHASGNGGNVVLIPGNGNVGKGKIYLKSATSTIGGGSQNLIIDTDTSGLVSQITSNFDKLSLITNLSHASVFPQGLIINNQGAEYSEVRFRNSYTYNDDDANGPAIRFDNRVSAATLNQSAFGEWRIGAMSNPRLTISSHEDGIAAVKAHGGLIIANSAVSLPHASSIQLTSVSSQLIGENENNWAATTIVPKLYSGSGTIRTERLYGTFDLNGIATKTLTFSKNLHGYFPVPSTALMGKMILGWTGNKGAYNSAGAVIEFLFSVFLDGSGNVIRTATSLGGGTPGIPGTTNGFDCLSSSSASANTGLVPDMLTIAIGSASGNDFKFDISTTNNSGVCRFMFEIEYKGILSA